jgi:hypothetical protein
MYFEEIEMTTKSFNVQRITVTSLRPFADVLARLESKIGHPDMGEFKRDLDSKVEALLTEAAA